MSVTESIPTISSALFPDVPLNDDVGPVSSINSDTTHNDADKHDDSIIVEDGGGDGGDAQKTDDTLVDEEQQQDDDDVQVDDDMINMKVSKMTVHHHHQQQKQSRKRSVNDQCKPRITSSIKSSCDQCFVCV